MTERQADHSIACGVFTNDDFRCTCKEDPVESARNLASDRLDPCYGVGSQEPPQAPSRDGIPLSERELGPGIEAGQVCNCGSPGTVGREPTAAQDRGPAGWRSHGLPRQGASMRGALPDNQEGRSQGHGTSAARTTQWFSRPLWVHFVAAPSFAAIVTLPLWWSHV